jgi:hypothetical protein
MEPLLKVTAGGGLLASRVVAGTHEIQLAIGQTLRSRQAATSAKRPVEFVCTTDPIRSTTLPLMVGLWALGPSRL